MRPLSKLESQTLSQYLKFREQPPTFARLLFNVAWVRVIAACGLLVAHMTMMSFAGIRQPASALLSVFMGGFVLGSFLQAAAILVRFRKIWPLLSAVIDWPAVERVLAEGMPDAAGVSPFAPQPAIETGNPFQSPRS